MPNNELAGFRYGTAILIQGKSHYGCKIFRPYTLISNPNEPGYFELMIKTYKTGNVSEYIDKLQIGDSIKVKGPIPTLKFNQNMKKKIGMLAGGTGITPMLQIIQAILNNPNDETEITLVYSNHSTDDILVKVQYYFTFIFYILHFIM